MVCMDQLTSPEANRCKYQAMPSILAILALCQQENEKSNALVVKQSGTRNTEHRTQNHRCQQTQDSESDANKPRIFHQYRGNSSNCRRPNLSSAKHLPSQNSSRPSTRSSSPSSSVADIRGTLAPNIFDFFILIPGLGVSASSALIPSIIPIHLALAILVNIVAIGIRRISSTSSSPLACVVAFVVINKFR